MKKYTFGSSSLILLMVLCVFTFICSIIYAYQKSKELDAAQTELENTQRQLDSLINDSKILKVKAEEARFFFDQLNSDKKSISQKHDSLKN